MKLRDFDHQSNSVEEAVRARRSFLEKEVNISLQPVSEMAFSPKKVAASNTENLIGATHLPLGVTSPLLVHGEYAQGSFYIPLATTEKSLVAGISRGCKLVTSAGGAETFIEQDHMTRAPIFQCDSLRTVKKLLHWLEENQMTLEKKVEAGSRYIRLLSSRSWVIGRNVYVRWSFHTGDAMGMNVVTKLSQQLAELLEGEVKGVKHVSVSGNMCIDKKPAAINLIEGRGKRVTAGVQISRALMQEQLQLNPEQLWEIHYRKNLLGSAQAGALGFNTHFANMIAALFIATGQDPAQVVEGAMGFTLVEPNEEGVYISVTLPALEVATVGGGTSLAPQKAALAMLGCEGSGEPAGSNARKLAEITASVVLAGEISLLAAEGTHTLAKAHE